MASTRKTSSDKDFQELTDAEIKAGRNMSEIDGKSPGILERMGSFFGLGGEKTSRNDEIPTGSPNKYLKDAKGNTILKDGAPVKNPDYNRDVADMAAAGYQIPSQESLKAQMKGDLSKLTKGQSTANATVPGQAEYGTLTSEKPAEPWTMGRVFDNLKREAGGVGDVISKGASSTGKGILGGLGAVKDFAASNKELTGLGIQGIGAYGGYKAGESAREAQSKYAQQQLEESQRIGSEIGKIQYPGQMYSTELGGIEQGLAKGGMTKELERGQQLANRAGMSVASSGMSAATDLAARTGGKTTAGSTLLQQLLSGQMGGNRTTDLMMSIGVQADKNAQDLRKRKSELESQQFKEQSGLATSKDTMAYNRANQTAAARQGLSNIEAGRGAASADLWSTGADLARQAVGNLQAPTTAQPATAPAVDPKGQALKNASQTGVKVGTPPTKTTTQPVTKGQELNKMNTQNQSPGIIQQGIDKGRELMSKMPQAQQDQLTKVGSQAMSQVQKGATDLVAGLLKKK